MLARFRGVSVGVQWNTVDQNQHIPPAQCLTIVRDGVAGVGHARNHLAEHGGQAVGALPKLLNFFAFEQVDLTCRGHEIILGTSCHRNGGKLRCA